MAGSTFSDSWHRIADARVGLLPTVRVHKQQFRGRTWYVLREVYSQRYYRVSPAAYAFLARLTPARTVDETWKAFLADEPEQAPGQEEVSQLLSQLHFANLLYFRSSPDSQAIFQRALKQRRRELRAQLMAFLYVRVPLWDPNRWLDRMRPLGRFLMSPLMGLVWLVVVLMGGVAALENADALLGQSQGILSLGNLPLLYLCLAGLKTLHEFGHAFVCKRFGGEVHTLGVMFLIFTPLPYVDVTTAWSFRNRWERALVGSAGMMVELFCAAIGAVIWANTGAGIINSLAFNVMAIGSVSSLLFNGNPLLRFDAYYIFADVVDIPNLYQKAQRQWLYFADRYLLGTPGAHSPAEDAREWAWLTGYGLLSFFYRLLIMVGILLFVLDRWFELGVVLALTSLFALVVMPAQKLISYLSSPQVFRNRGRAIGATVASMLLVVAVLGWLPMPNSVKAQGVLEAVEATTVYTDTEGRLAKLHVSNGDAVKQGQVLAVLVNPELNHDIDITRQQRREAELLQRQALQQSVADLEPLRRRLEVLEQRLRELEWRHTQLVVRAPHDGDWVAPALHEHLGTWVSRGRPLGEVLNHDQFRFTAVIPQEQADALFQTRLEHAQLRLQGQADTDIALVGLQLIPYQRRQLASPALGWFGGGDIAVSREDDRGDLAAEPFFELRAQVAADNPDFVALHGLSGRLRIALPSQPVFAQAREALMQLLQKRYQL